MLPRDLRTLCFLPTSGFFRRTTKSYSLLAGEQKQTENQNPLFTSGLGFAPPISARSGSGLPHICHALGLLHTARNARVAVAQEVVGPRLVGWGGVGWGGVGWGGVGRGGVGWDGMGWGGVGWGGKHAKFDKSIN